VGRPRRRQDLNESPAEPILGTVKRGRAALLVAGAVPLVVAACGSPSGSPSHSTQASSHPTAIDGAASSVTQSSSTLIGLGTATATTGAVEFLSGTNAALVATVPLGGPVHDVIAGSNGSTFYALNGTATSMSVAIVNSLAKSIFHSVPVPLDTVSIAVDPAQQRIYALESSGQVAIVSSANGQILSRFLIGPNPVAMVTSGDGTTMYILKGTSHDENVGVFDLALQKQTKALPAPANTVDISVSSANTTLYAFVGTPTLGNVQLIDTK
jgi:DNA-binding beta-propeller fold protein YncE